MVLLPGSFLMLVPAIGGVGLLLGTRWIDWSRLAFGAAVLAALSLCWAFIPLVTWLNSATQSLAAIPMAIDPAILAPSEVVRRLAVPAILIGGALWQVRHRLPQRLHMPALGACAVAVAIAFHSLYRIAFTDTILASQAMPA